MGVTGNQRSKYCHKQRWLWRRTNACTDPLYNPPCPLDPSSGSFQHWQRATDPVPFTLLLYRATDEDHVVSQLLWCVVLRVRALCFGTKSLVWIPVFMVRFGCWARFVYSYKLSFVLPAYTNRVIEALDLRAKGRGTPPNGKSVDYKANSRAKGSNKASIQVAISMHLFFSLPVSFF